MEAFRKMLDENMRIIQTLDKDKYPNLGHMCTRATLRTLIGTYDAMRGYDHPWHIGVDGTLFFAISLRFIRNEWAKNHLGASVGALETWQSKKIVLLDAGLLNRIVPSETSTVKDFKLLYERAQTNGVKPENILYVRPYTTELLDRSEKIIAELRSKTGLGRVTKRAMILGHGQEAADRMYLDKRQIHHKDEEIMVSFNWNIKKIIQENGYAMVDKVIDGVVDFMMRAYGEKRKDCIGRIEQIWLEHKRYILTEANADYRAPRIEEKRRYKLIASKWAIWPIPEESD